MHQTLFDHDVERQVINTVADASLLDVGQAKLMLERSGLIPIDFHLPAHAALVRAARTLLFKKGQPFDLLSVKALLESSEGLEVAGGWEYLVKCLASDAVHTTGFNGHVKYLKDLALRRRLVEELKQAALAAADRDKEPGPIVAELTSKLAGMARFTGVIRTLRQVMDSVVDSLESVQQGKSGIVSTGVRVLDEAVGGLQPTLTLIGALPAVGKSALIATILHSLARRGEKCALFTLEDESAWLGWRILSQESGVDQFVLRWRRKNNYDLERTSSGMSRMNEYMDNVLLCDGSEVGMTPEEIVMASNDLILNHKVKAIIVDHLGEIRMPGQDDHHLKVTRALSMLRGVANRHGVPMVVAAHFRRRDGLGPNDTPTLSDFADSSGAERRARVAIGLSRAPDSDVLTMHVLKNTNGKAGFAVQAQFKGAAAMVASVEGED